jgi:hypothetical protein
LDYHVRMTLVVDELEVPMMKARLAECVEGFDPQPRFVTAAWWLVQATEALKGQPEPVPGNGYKVEHAGTIKRSGGFVRE